MILEIILIIIGFIFLIKGADLLVKAAISIAKKFGLSEMVIGLTVLAVGTSLPEVFITITSSLNGYSDLIIGNAIGSCICNFLFVIGLTSVISPVKFDKRIVQVHLPIGLFAMLLLAFLGNTENLGDLNVITRWQGVILLIFTVLYILYTIYEERKIHDTRRDEEILEEVEAKEHYPTKTIIIYLILGILGLKFGSDFVVDNAVSIASSLGLSESFIGMTVVAIGTALPEIMTGIISARKKETDLLLGNITGSNIINLCLLIGLGAVISPLAFSTDFNQSIILLIAVTLLLQLLATVNKKGELDRKRGILLIASYILYIIYMA